MSWQDFGNFQDMEGKEREKTERLRFGRFFYRFPNGESGAGAHMIRPSVHNQLYMLESASSGPGHLKGHARHMHLACV